jgi:hypothetical protein
MRKVFLCNVLLFIVLILSLSTIILYSVGEYFDISYNSYNKKIMLKDDSKTRPSYICLIIVAVLSAVIILYNLIISSFFINKKIPTIISLILVFAMFVTSFVGIGYFDKVNFSKSFDLEIFSFKIKENNTDVVSYQILTYLTFGFSIITSLVCSGLAIAYLSNKKK